MNKIIYTILAMAALTSCANSYNIQGTSNVSMLDGRMLYLKVYNKDNLKVADGIGFNDYNDSGLGYAVGLSRELFEDKKAFWTCVKNAMKCDHSWKNSANEYLKIYHSLAS